MNSSLSRVVPLALLLTAACNESGPRVFTAKAYDRDAMCLEADAPIGLVEAETLKATCDPVCLELNGELYASTICPPYPADSSELAADSSADCAAALNALASKVQCGE